MAPSGFRILNAHRFSAWMAEKQLVDCHSTSYAKRRGPSHFEPERGLLMLNMSRIAVGLLLLATIPVAHQANHESPDEIQLSEQLKAAARDSQPVDLPEMGRGGFPQRRELDGKWQLAWDDVVDDRLDGEDKVCAIELREIGGVITGQFIGDVAGRPRDGFLSGRLEGTGPSRLLTFQQREEGYVCSYQAFDAGGEIRGVWHDTQNRSGTFRLLRFQ